MARRGRFGRSDTGTSNLSAAIASLLSQQQAQAERTFMTAYYNGTDYNGKVPSMSDVVAFYGDYTSTSGIEPGTDAYIAIQQKIDEANNYDIKRTYNQLISDFNNSGGTNYQQVIDFLTGRANDSTNADDVRAYAAAVKDTTSSFITFSANRLTRGSISIETFRSSMSQALSLLDPTSETYADALSTVKATELDHEKARMDLKLSSGEINYSKYLTWARDFKNSLSSVGLPAGDITYDKINAIIADAGKRAASAAAAATAKKSGIAIATAENQILNLYAIAASSGVVPTDDVTLKKLVSGDPFTMKDVMANPEVIAAYQRLVDTGDVALDPRLEMNGINDGTQLNRYYDSLVKEYHGNSAKLYAVTGNKGDYETYQAAKRLDLMTGQNSGIEKIADAAVQYSIDLQNAGGDDFALMGAFAEWSNYLSGKQSKYGVIPPDSDTIPAEYSQDATLFNAWLSNSRAVMLDGFIPGPGQMTFEGALGINLNVGTSTVSINDIYSNGSIDKTASNVSMLVNGQMAQQISVKDGKISVESVGLPAINSTGSIGGSDVQAKYGRLNQISFRVINGQMVPVLQTIVASNVIQTADGYDASGNPVMSDWGFKYITKDGEEVYVRKSDGATFDTNPFNSPLGVVDPEKGVMAPVAGGSQLSDSATSTGGVPSLDISSVYSAIGGMDNQVRIRGIADALVGANGQAPLLDPNNPAHAAMLAVIGADKNGGIASAVEALNNRADQVELKNLQIQSFTASERGAMDPIAATSINARIAELQHKLNPQAYSGTFVEQMSKFSTIVVPNKDKYYESEPGVWRLKPEYVAAKTRDNAGLIMDVLAGAGAGAAAGSLGGPVGIGTGIIGGALVGVAQSFARPSQYEELPVVVNVNPTKPVDYAAQISSAAKTSYLNNAGVTPQSDSPYTYFRNLSTAVPNATPRALPIATPNLPTVPVLSASVPKTKQQAQSLISAMPFNASDPEARRALVQLSSTLPSQVSASTGTKFLGGGR